MMVELKGSDALRRLKDQREVWASALARYTSERARFEVQDDVRFPFAANPESGNMTVRVNHLSR